MEKIFRNICWVLEMVYKALCEFSKLVLVIIVLVVSAQVFCRKFLGFSIRWSEEVALLFMVWMAFISLAIGVEKDLHISITMFFEKFNPKIQWIITKATDLLMATLGFVMMDNGFKLIKVASLSTLPATKWPASILYYMIPISGFFIIYFSLIKLFDAEKIRRFKFNEKEMEELSNV